MNENIHFHLKNILKVFVFAFISYNLWIEILKIVLENPRDIEIVRNQES